MNSLPRTGGSENLFLQLAHDDDESATVAQFLTLYRQSAKFRHWLHEDFGPNSALQSHVESIGRSTEARSFSRFADLTDDAKAWKEERRQLKTEVSGQIYGGLTHGQLEKLILRYQSGSIDLGAFLLAHQWRQAGQSAPDSPVLARGALNLIDSALRGGQLRLLRHLAKADRFLTSYANKKKRRSTVSYGDWWKLNALFYILRHPSNAYRTRELRAHLTGQGMEVGTKDIRRFCSKHGIRRDMRAGRPRTKSAKV